MSNEQNQQDNGHQQGGKVGMDATKAQTKQAADFDKTVEDAEDERGERKPGSSSGHNTSQHNNGRGGGK